MIISGEWYDHIPSHSTGSKRYSEVIFAGSFKRWSSQDWPKKISAAYVYKEIISKMNKIGDIFNLTIDPSLIESKLITVTWNSTLVGLPKKYIAFVSVVVYVY